MEGIASGAGDEGDGREESPDIAADGEVNVWLRERAASAVGSYICTGACWKTEGASSSGGEVDRISGGGERQGGDEPGVEAGDERN